MFRINIIKNQIRSWNLVHLVGSMIIVSLHYYLIPSHRIYSIITGIYYSFVWETLDYLYSIYKFYFRSKKLRDILDNIFDVRGSSYIDYLSGVLGSLIMSCIFRIYILKCSIILFIICLFLSIVILFKEKNWE